MIGEKISPILEEIEILLWEFEANCGAPPKYTKDGFRAVLKIFMSAIMDKMWELQEKENIPMEDRAKMATKCGQNIREIVKTYTNVNAMKLYDEV